VHRGRRYTNAVTLVWTRYEEAASVIHGCYITKLSRTLPKCELTTSTQNNLFVSRGHSQMPLLMCDPIIQGSQHIDEVILESDVSEVSRSLMMVRRRI